MRKIESLPKDDIAAQFPIIQMPHLKPYLDDPLLSASQPIRIGATLAFGDMQLFIDRYASRITTPFQAIVGSEEYVVDIDQIETVYSRARAGLKEHHFVEGVDHFIPMIKEFQSQFLDLQKSFLEKSLTPKAKL